MKLSIILLNFNRAQLTLECIESLRKHYKKEFVENIFEIVVADNGSSDDSITILRSKKYESSHGPDSREIKNITIIENKANLGFGKGNNEAAKYAKGEFLLFLNNDTKVLDEGFLGMIEVFNKDESIGIVGGKMLNDDGSAQASAGKFYTFFNAIRMIFGLQRLGFLYTSPNSIKKVDWVSGGSLMIRRSIYEKIHGFDNDIFMYMEDVDICYRVKKIGYSTYFYPGITISHKQHGSGSRTFAIVNIYQSLLVFYKKHMPPWQYFVIQLLLRLKAVSCIAIGKSIGNNYLVDTYEKALASI